MVRREIVKQPKSENVLLTLDSWMGDVDIRTYNKLVFEPCKKVPKVNYNLWKG